MDRHAQSWSAHLGTQPVGSEPAPERFQGRQAGTSRVRRQELSDRSDQWEADCSKTVARTGISAPNARNDLIIPSPRFLLLGGVQDNGQKWHLEVGGFCSPRDSSVRNFHRHSRTILQVWKLHRRGDRVRGIVARTSLGATSTVQSSLIIRNGVERPGGVHSRNRGQT